MKCRTPKKDSATLRLGDTENLSVLQEEILGVLGGMAVWGPLSNFQNPQAASHDEPLRIYAVPNSYRKITFEAAGVVWSLTLRKGS